MYPYRLRFSFKVPKPRAEKTVWGDLTIAEGLSAALRERGYHCRIDLLEDWEQPDDSDVAIHVRGLHQYFPKPHQINLMWLISHPNKIRDYELAGYDGFLVVSKPFAERLRPKVEAPVIPFFQQTDPRLFHPGEEKPKYDVVFIGNNIHRGRKIRKIIEDLLQTHHRCSIWGARWHGVVPEDWIVSDYVSKGDSAKICRQARIILGDHHDDMRDEGFVCERNFDALASGALIISDAVLGIEEVIDIPVYRTPADLEKLLDRYLTHEEERQALVARLRQKVLEEFTFERRATQLLDFLDEVIPRALQKRHSPPPAPLVSILATTYNRRDLLPRALKSAIGQTFRDWEMILVNDGGEEVGDIVEQLGDSRIRYVNSDHVGKGHALNAGLRQARGRYIAYLDDDDYYYPEHLERLVKALRESPAAGMVYTDFEEIMEEAAPEGMRALSRREVDLHRLFPAFLYGLPHMACLHYKSLFEEAGRYDESLSIYIDWDMLQRLALVCRPRHLPGASMVHTLRVQEGRRAADHIHAIHASNPKAGAEKWLKLIDRTIALMESHPSLRALRQDYLVFRNRLDLMAGYLRIAGEPRRPGPFAEMARKLFEQTYLTGVREGAALARGEPVGCLEAAPEAAESLAWLEQVEFLRKEIDRLQAACDEQWAFILRVRNSAPYKLFRLLKSILAKIPRALRPKKG